LGDTRGYSKSGHASHLEMDEEEEVRRSGPAPRGSYYDGAALAEDEDEEEEFVSVEPVPAAVGDEVFDEEDEDEEEEEGEVNGGRGLDTERFASSMYSQAEEEEAPIDDDDDDEEDQEITDVIPMAESPYETEIDPVTGIYRLKTRQNPSPAFAADERQYDTGYGATEGAMEVSPEGEISGENELIHHTEPIHTASSIDLSGNVHWESEEQAPTPENDWWKGSSEEAQQLNIPMPNKEEESDDEANQFAHREQD